MYLDINYMKHHLERVNIEGLSSLKSLSLKLESIEENSFGKMNSLKELTLDVKNEINNDMSTKLFETCPNIEKLCLNGKFSNINLDNFVNLKNLELHGDILDGFNFDLFKNICKQLEKLSIEFKNIDDESTSKLLYGHSFPYVSYINISNSKITRFEKKLFDGFPMLQLLGVALNSELKTIDKDAFWNLKNLKMVEFAFNTELSELQPELFSCLAKLEKLRFDGNGKLRRFDLKIFDYIVNIKMIHFFGESIENKEEIFNHLKNSNIDIIISNN